MAVTAGALSSSKVQAIRALITSAAASGGTGPYTYQLHKSKSSGFTPSGATEIAGATALSNMVENLDPSSTYYFKMVATDTGAGNAQSISSQLAVVTSPGQSQNQFSQNALAGQLDLKVGPTNVISAQIDQSSAGGLRVAQAVKIMAASRGLPKVVECAANDDDVFGFIIFQAKDQVRNQGDMVEIARKGSIIHLVAVGAVAAGEKVTLDLSYVGGVASANSGDRIVGRAIEKASGAGELVRVELSIQDELAS